MNNDQIKEQIESAKRAFIEAKGRKRPDIGSDEGLSNNVKTSDLQSQQEILERVSNLMNDAAQTLKGNFNPNENSSEAPRPFWAQTKTDLSSFEQWERQHSMTNNDDEPEKTPKAPSLSDMPDLSTPAPEEDTDIALSAIRDDIIGRIDNVEPTINEAALAELTNKISALETRFEEQQARIDKHQQDITALLQLVRQTNARQKQDSAEPRSIAQDAPSKSSGITGLVLLMTFLIIAAITGWLFWMNPILMINLATMLINEAFTTMMKIVAMTGLI
tara:strand:+ start:223 stop:1047 length:825 start_codon:yes stop_codon:yes gene_type:complete